MGLFVFLGEGGVDLFIQNLFVSFGVGVFYLALTP